MALMTDLFNVLLALLVVSAATFLIVVSIAVVSSLLLLPNTVYIFWFWEVYPIWPAMLRNCIANMQRVYDPPMKVLRAGYVLVVIASQSLNSFNGKMLYCINKRMALLIICVSEYGSRARTRISWHFLIL